MKRVFAFSALILLGITSASSFADAPEFKEVRFSLIHAQSEDIEESMPLAPELRKSLEKLFGYQKYRVLGEARSALDTGAEPVHFQPNPLFYVRMSRVGNTPCRYRFELMREEDSLFKGEYLPKPEVPLIIRGPFYDKGNLVLVIRSEFRKP